MSRDEDLYDDLLKLDDDRAWKYAVGQALRELVVQTRKTNGRVTTIEAWKNRITGTVALMVFAVPIMSAWLMKFVVK